MSQNTNNVEPEYKDEGQILKPSTTEHPLYGKIVDACKTVYDPEIPVNIYDLGLIYTVEISDENDAKILMEPQWGMEMMSDEARLELGFM